MNQVPMHCGLALRSAMGLRFMTVSAGGERTIRSFGVGCDSIRETRLAGTRRRVTQLMGEGLMERVRSGAQGAVTSVTFAQERFADSLPVFSNLLSTSTGTVWVVAPSWPGHAPASMKAYTLRGARVGDVQLPRAFTPLAVTDSVVAGYLLDANDVATVALYRLRAGSGGR